MQGSFFDSSLAIPSFSTVSLFSSVDNLASTIYWPNSSEHNIALSQGLCIWLMQHTRTTVAEGSELRDSAVNRGV